VRSALRSAIISHPSFSFERLLDVTSLVSEMSSVFSTQLDTAPPLLRVAVVAEDPRARAGLGALVSEPHGFEVVAQGRSIAEVLAPLENASAQRPAVDVLVVDGLVPASAVAPSSLVGVVAIVQDEAEARAALEGGVRGVVRRDSGARVLHAIVRAVSEGLIAIDPALGELWSHEPERPRTSAASARAVSEELTPRESEVLQWLAEGLANKQIAARLGISDHTVKFHVNALMAKLGVQSRTEAVVRAARKGWLQL
jgi:DNA-binding NarL/FixJ family response regulator